MNLLEITQPIPVNIKYFYNIDYLLLITQVIYVITDQV